MLKAMITAVLMTLCVGTFAADTLPLSANKVSPLLVGSMLPDVNFFTIEGNAITLKSQLNGKPAVVVFYRGGWCPYCNLQLSSLRLIKKDLDVLGYELIAISPDRPEELKASLDKLTLDYTLLSDAKALGAKAFGIGFKVDDITFEKYKGYNIDLEKSSGEKHHILPVPSIFIADAEGRLQFSYVNPDYKARLPETVILEAAKFIVDEKQYLKRK